MLIILLETSKGSDVNFMSMLQRVNKYFKSIIIIVNKRQAKSKPVSSDLLFNKYPIYFVIVL